MVSSTFAAEIAVAGSSIHEAFMALYSKLGLDIEKILVFGSRQKYFVLCWVK